jgi:hypothetical protein
VSLPPDIQEHGPLILQRELTNWIITGLDFFGKGIAKKRKRNINWLNGVLFVVLKTKVG